MFLFYVKSAPKFKCPPPQLLKVESDAGRSLEQVFVYSLHTVM